MDGLTLLRDARSAGLLVEAHGDRLVLQGPRRLEPVAHRLLVEKPRVLLALMHEEGEVRWRVDAMRAQATAAGGLPLLLARPGIPFTIGSCYSCGAVLESSARYRCNPCVVAAVAALGETD